MNVASVHTQDARTLNHSNPSTIGRAEVVSFYGDMIRNGISRFSYTTTGVWGSDNNLICDEGLLSFAFSNGKVVAKGRYLLGLKKSSNKINLVCL